MDDVTTREIDRILERLELQDATIARLSDEVSAMNAKLREILTFQSQQKGAINVLVVVCGAVSAAIGWGISLFLGK